MNVYTINKCDCMLVYHTVQWSFWSVLWKCEWVTLCLSVSRPLDCCIQWWLVFWSVYERRTIQVHITCVSACCMNTFVVVRFPNICVLKTKSLVWYRTCVVTSSLVGRKERIITTTFFYYNVAFARCLILIPRCNVAACWLFGPNPLCNVVSGWLFGITSYCYRRLPFVNYKFTRYIYIQVFKCLPGTWLPIGTSPVRCERQY